MHVDLLQKVDGEGVCLGDPAQHEQDGKEEDEDCRQQEEMAEGKRGEERMKGNKRKDRGDGAVGGKDKEKRWV